MPVISFINVKGGSCKTTSAIAIGSELALMVPKVAMIDTDPAQRLVRWYKKNPNLVKHIKLIAHTDENTLGEVIRDVRKEYDFVIVDTEGTARERNMRVASASDLVIVPMRANQQDVEDGVRTFAYLESIEADFEKNIAAVILFAATKHIPSRLSRMLMDTMKSKYRVIETGLQERTAYDNLLNNGGSLKDLGKDVSGVPETKKNCIDVVEDISLLFEELKTEKLTGKETVNA